MLLDRSIYRALLTRGAFLIGLQDHHLYRDQEKCRLYVYVYIHTQTRLHVYTYILVDKEGSEIIIFAETKKNVTCVGIHVYTNT